MTRYEVVRDIPDDWGAIVVRRHPDQPLEGFPSATEASLWCETPPRFLSGEWYIRPMEAK